MKHLHGRYIISPSEETSLQGSLWRGNRAVTSFVLNKSTFLYFHHKEDVF